MKTQSAFAICTTISGCLGMPLATAAAPVTNPVSQHVYVIEAVRPVKDESLDVDDFIAQLSAETDISADLADARRWVGESIGTDSVQGLKKLRLAAGLSQKQLADVIGLKQPNISAIEAGARTPSAKTLIRMSAALNVTADALLAALSVGEESHD